jgi:hypothetical protein
MHQEWNTEQTNIYEQRDVEIQRGTCCTQKNKVLKRLEIVLEGGVYMRAASWPQWPPQPASLPEHLASTPKRTLNNTNPNGGAVEGLSGVGWHICQPERHRQGCQPLHDGLIALRLLRHGSTNTRRAPPLTKLWVNTNPNARHWTLELSAVTSRRTLSKNI